MKNVFSKFLKLQKSWSPGWPEMIWFSPKSSNLKLVKFQNSEIMKSRLMAPCPYYSQKKKVWDMITLTLNCFWDWSPPSKIVSSSLSPPAQQPSIWSFYSKSKLSSRLQQYGCLANTVIYWLYSGRLSPFISLAQIFLSPNFFSSHKIFQVGEIFKVFLKTTFLHVSCHGDHF